MSSVVKMRGVTGTARRQRRIVHRLVQGLRAAWQRILANLATHFPPDEPQPSPPLAKAAALREGALLSEHVDARSKSRVA
jgi:alkylated DNA nucleotide flippase Atl1